MPAKLLIKKISTQGNSGTEWLRGEIVANIDPALVLGSSDGAAGGNFVYFTVTDKTTAEMQEFLDQYNRNINMAVFQGPDGSGLRSIHVQNLNIDASGIVGAWTVEQADIIIANWNELYPTCGLITLGFPQPDTWDCQGTFTTGQASEFEQVVYEQGLQVMDKRTLWYITPAGMTNIENAGGSQSGTAAQLAGIIRDARLD